MGWREPPDFPLAGSYMKHRFAGYHHRAPGSSSDVATTIFFESLPTPRGPHRVPKNRLILYYIPGYCRRVFFPF